MGMLRFLRNIISIKDSAIGKGLRQSPRLLATTTAVAVAILTLALILTTSPGQQFDQGLGLQLTLALTGCLYLGFVASQAPGTATALGFRTAPRQGWFFWLWVCAAIGVVQLLVLLIWEQLSGMPLVRAQPLTWHRFLSSCVNAPVREEILYRMIPCAPAIALARSWGGVAISGAIFWFAHYVAGVASLEHLMAGFIGAWFFVKCETIILPIVTHSLSNLFMLTWAAILLAGTPSVPPVPAELKHPAEIKGLKSARSDVETTIRFVNNSKQTIKVYVLSYQGERQFEGIVKDGQNYENTKTSPTHMWLITDENDEAWYVYSPDGQPRTVEIVAPEKKH